VTKANFVARAPSFISNSKQGEKISEQDILKVFDVTDDPFLTATEIADQLPVSRQAVNYRLEKMFEKGKVNKKKTGPGRSVGGQRWRPEFPMRPKNKPTLPTVRRQSLLTNSRIDLIEGSMWQRSMCRSKQPTGWLGPNLKFVTAF